FNASASLNCAIPNSCSAPRNLTRDEIAFGLSEQTFQHPVNCREVTTDFDDFQPRAGYPRSHRSRAPYSRFSLWRLTVFSISTGAKSSVSTFASLAIFT